MLPSTMTTALMTAEELERVSIPGKVTELANPKGESKLLPQCTLPLTGVKCVKKIVTELAVLEVTPNGFVLLERAPGISVEEIKNKTAGKLIIEGDVPEMISV